MMLIIIAVSHVLKPGRLVCLGRTPPLLALCLSLSERCSPLNRVESSNGSQTLWEYNPSTISTVYTVAVYLPWWTS